MHGFARVVATVAGLLALSVPARADRWVASWTGPAQGPYPAGNPTAQPELRFALPSPELGARDRSFRLIVRSDEWGPDRIPARRFTSSTILRELENRFRILLQT